MNKIVSLVVIAAFSLTAYGTHGAAALLRRVEGYRASPYLCQAGEWAIGYGFTAPSLIAKGSITQREAETELNRICTAIQTRLRRELKHQRLTPNEEAAVISFIYNVGWYRFKTSTMFRLLIHGKRGKIVADEFRRWVYVSNGGRKVKSRGMQKRRMIEASTFLKG